MTRISFIFASAALTIGLVPAAHAYAAEETAAPLQTSATSGTCTLTISPQLAAALNLPATATASTTTTVACNG